MRFYEVFLGSKHEIWSKQHSGKVSLFRYDALLSLTNIFGLHYGVWHVKLACRKDTVVDWLARQAYNVFIIMAPCERW